MATLLSTPVAAQSLEELKRQIDELAAKIEQLEKAQQRVWTVEEEPSPRFISPDGRFSMKLLGRLYVDAGWISDRNDTADIRATELRTARLGIEGRTGRRIGFKFEGIFDQDSVDVKDAYISLTGPLEIKVGHFKVATSLDEATSSKMLGLMERAAFTDAFGFDRGLGVGVFAGGQSWSFQGGLAARFSITPRPRRPDGCAAGHRRNAN